MLGVVLVLSIAVSSVAQRGSPAVSKEAGGYTVFGDVEVTGPGAEDKPLIFDLMLYTQGGTLRERQRVGSKGRYRFNNIAAGDYDIVVSFENSEVSRTHIKLSGTLAELRQDIALELRSDATTKPKPATISAEDVYDRKGSSRERFEKAEAALDAKEYDKAVALLRQIVGDDPRDFQAWTELGTAYLTQKNLGDAEKSYLLAIEARPTFFLALLNLGRLRLMQKNYEGAIKALDSAVTVQPKSAEANFFLGDAYLQVKKGSKAVGYLYTALDLEPIKMAEAHLRLALLYNGAGMKDKAAAEYEQFLTKVPDYPQRKQLEQYITANKKP
jgi:tetratricopeptide (TPR) repeat protein